MKLKLFLTYDHELPLGKLKTSFSEALFEPTYQVFNVAAQCGVRVNLFTDILCASRYKEWDYNNFYTPYKKQLSGSLNAGHDVQLHIHPHWLTSVYENSEVKPSSDFGLSDFSEKAEFGGISGIVKKSITDLTEICTETKPDYKCIAYRAGGYNIAPNTIEIFDALQAGGIQYDSSIAPGYFFKSGISEVDFRKLPALPNWIIQPENLSKTKSEPGILEIPIATIPKTPFEVPTFLKMKKYAHRAPASRGEVIHTSGPDKLADKLKMLFSARMLSFDNYTLSLSYLMKIVDYNVRKHKKADSLMLSVISHHKSMGNYSFELMKRFIDEVHRKYPEAEFLTFSDLNNQLNK